MPKRQILIRIAQVAALAAAAAVVIAIVVMRGSGDSRESGPPDPPRDDTVVIEGEDGWFVALPDGPLDGRAPRIWMQSKELDATASDEVGQLYVSFRPIPNDHTVHVSRVQGWVPLPGSDWFGVVVSGPSSEGDYDVVLSRGSNELARRAVTVTFEELDGVNVQRWQAEGIAMRADGVASGYQLSLCLARTYDESSAHWDVTCHREDATTTTWTVDGQSGATNQTSGPTPVELDGPVLHGF